MGAYCACRPPHRFSRSFLRAPVFEKAAMLLPGNVDEHAQIVLDRLFKQPLARRKIDAHTGRTEIAYVLEITFDLFGFGQEFAASVRSERPVAKPPGIPLLL